MLLVYTDTSHEHESRPFHFHLHIHFLLRHEPHGGGPFRKKVPEPAKKQVQE